MIKISGYFWEKNKIVQGILKNLKTSEFERVVFSPVFLAAALQNLDFHFHSFDLKPGQISDGVSADA